jgi:hypothetical protein
VEHYWEIQGGDGGGGAESRSKQRQTLGWRNMYPLCSSVCLTGQLWGGVEKIKPYLTNCKVCLYFRCITVWNQ